MTFNRLAFKIFLKPNSLGEYKKRHSEIRSELKPIFKEAGVGAYHIYHDPQTNCLFAYQETNGSDSQSLGENPIIKK